MRHTSESLLQEMPSEEKLLGGTGFECDALNLSGSMHLAQADFHPLEI